jgi:hypothetical protein
VTTSPRTDPGTDSRPEPGRAVRAGDRVRVRPAEEILAGLDDNGRLDGLPFMPEMLAFAGQELAVYKRADKTCDTVTPSSHFHRRLDATVHLVGARCDGSAHGGCQARCLLFFRQEWLTRADGSALPETTGASGTGTATVEVLDADTRAETPDDRPRYRCQATELLNASTRLSPYEFGQYVTDVRTGNERLRTVLAGLAVTLVNKYQRSSRKLPAALRLRDGAEYPWLRGTGPSPAPPPLNLQPGELVEIRGKDEILPTLRPDNTTRGLSFDAEMLPFVGTRARVLARVERIIDERTGRMLKLRDCIILEDVYCRSYYHRFCPRAIYSYWREQWLRRVPEDQQP